MEMRECTVDYHYRRRNLHTRITLYMVSHLRSSFLAVFYSGFLGILPAENESHHMQQMVFKSIRLYRLLLFNAKKSYIKVFVDICRTNKGETSLTM